MRWLIAGLLALLLAVAGGTLLPRYSGRLILNYGDYTVQTSIVVFALALLVCVALLVFLFHAILGAVALPGAIRRWTSGRQTQRQDARLEQGLIAMLRGDWSSAERHFSSAAQGGASLLNLLLAARAAERQGAPERQRDYLTRAKALPEGAQADLDLFEAELYLSEGRLGAAVTLLEKLHGERPKDAAIARLRAEACLRAELWNEALLALQTAETRGGKGAAQTRALQLRACLGLMRRAGAQKDRTALINSFKQAPGELRQDPELLLAYVGERIRLSGAGDCEPLLRDALQRKWDARLVEAYGLLRDDAAARLKAAERWLPGHPADAALCLALGRICRDAALWGKALEYFERALELNPTAETCRELGALLEQEGDAERAASYYKRGLLLASTRG